MDIDYILKRSIQINNSKLRDSYDNRIKTRKLAIMGGTFNPIHYGHLATAEAVRTKYKLDKIIFIPSGTPPHKKNLNIVDKIHRYNMTILATVSNDYFEVSSAEIEREGHSYTVDTLQRLKNLYSSSDIYFITGADALCEIETWKNIKENFNLATFIGATRPGIDFESVKRKVVELKEKYNARILNIHVPSLDISSTNLRKRLSENESIKYLLPENVEKYIYKYNLYR